MDSTTEDKELGLEATGNGFKISDSTEFVLLLTDQLQNMSFSDITQNKDGVIEMNITNGLEEYKVTYEKIK